MSVHDRVERVLKRNKLRYTKQRRRLIELMAAAGRPVTLPELLTEASELPQSSMYRNLDVLTQVGLVTRIPGSSRDSFELADALIEHHHHLVCDSCDLMTNVQLDESFEQSIDQAFKPAVKKFDFSPARHSINLHGRCSDCADPDA